MISGDALAMLRAAGFKDEDHVCVSPNKYAYQSVTLGDLASGEDSLWLTPNPGTKGVPTLARKDELLLASANPCRGPRSDGSVYRHQSFLVEVDTMPLKEQRAYFRGLGMPYTACVYSGGKSLHYLVSMEEPMPDEASWRHVARWALAIADRADQGTGTPSRMVRLPGPMRPGGRAQVLVDLRGPVSRADLFAWLSSRPDLKPPPPELPRRPSGVPSLDLVSPWALDELANGIDESRGRNNRWYALFCEMALAGYSEEEATEMLGAYFTEGAGFRRREWLGCARSAYRRMGGG